MKAFTARRVGKIVAAGWVGAVLLACAGCGSSGRLITIAARPADADLRVDDRNVGRGPYTDRFSFEDGKTHTITANRFGYQEQTFTLTEGYTQGDVLLTLPPRTRRVTIKVTPVPGVVTVDGKALSPEPVAQITTDLEFHLDARDNWIPHTASAERPGFGKADVAIRWQDGAGEYTIPLAARRKSVRIVTRPPGAEVFLDDESRGISPVTIDGLAIPFDAAAQQWERLAVRATKKGYDDAAAFLSWDNGQTEYKLDLGTKSKSVLVVVDPKDAQVSIPGADLKQDETGAWAGTLAFPPEGEAGEQKVYAGTVTKKTADAEWETLPLRIGWDGGQGAYRVSLGQVSRQVPLLRPVLARGAGGWRVKAETVATTARLNPAEPDGRRATRVVFLPGKPIDSLAVSPDGRQVVFSVPSVGDDGNLRAQLFVAPADGSGGLRALTDGQHLDLTPAYSPDGTKILFTSDRGNDPGRRPRVWQVAADGDTAPEPLTPAGVTALWPSLDSLPRPRLFYESRIDEAESPRLSMLPLPAGDDAAVPPADLPPAGRQPRINPRADRVLFTFADPRGKRDVCAIPVGAKDGGQNLTHSPAFDDFDPAWSRDGRRVAFASDRPPAGDKPGDLNLWVMDPDRPDDAARVTANESWDDCPAWDAAGKALFFRSNRGGEWGVWRIDVDATGR